MAFFCPCLRWLQLTQAQENSSPNQSHDSLPVNPDNDKRHYQGVRATGDNDTEQIHFNLLRSKRENDDVLDDCKSPLLNLLITTKNAITNKIQQGKELASDSISIAYNNPEKADKNCYISEKSRAAECVICLIEFSENNPKMPTLCMCGEHRANFHYPCLLLYLQKKKHCPVCNQELFYQELSRNL